MTSWNIAIVGAKGQVGSALIDLLQSSSLSCNNVYLLGSDNSEGEIVRFAGKNLIVKHIDKMNWHECHIAFFVAGLQVSQQYASIAAESGCIVIDASDYFAQNDNVPLVVPNVNDAVLSEYRNENIIAVANAVVCQALRTIASLTDANQLVQLNMTNFISASFYGRQGVNELAGQSAKLLNGLPAEYELFDKQLAFNILPIGPAQRINHTHLSFRDDIIIEQIRRITGDYQLSISVDSVFVPIFYGLTQSVVMKSALPLNIEDRALFEKYHIELFESDYPTPVTDVNSEHNDKLTIKLANLRRSYGDQEQIQFYTVSDNIRYLGAQMLLETAERLITDYI